MGTSTQNWLFSSPTQTSMPYPGESSGGSVSIEDDGYYRPTVFDVEKTCSMTSK